MSATVSPSLESLVVPTSAGMFRATFTSVGLARLNAPDRPRNLSTSAALDSESDPRIALLASILNAILSGQPHPPRPVLDLSVGTPFQRRVWDELLAIPAGSCRTYGEIAQRLGVPGASRAVGTACGANPIPLIVPCHRVLAAGGRIGGFAMGLEWKRHLLAAERSGRDSLL